MPERRAEMRKSIKNKLVAMLLAICTVLGMSIPASASSIQDGSKTCSVDDAPVHTYLQTTAGTWLRACGYDYTTNDGLTGPAYCIDHGLYYTGKVLPITGKYTVSPQTAGAFANGYPQLKLETFLGLHQNNHPILSGLTEYEYRYATQVAVWATLGQLAIEGTVFTNGREQINQPFGDAQQMRVFCAVQCILSYAKDWDKVYQTGMYIRVSDNKLDGNLAIDPDMTLEFAANAGRFGIKREIINGKSYYTKVYTFASATSTYYQDYTMDLWATNCPAGTIFTDLKNVELVGSKWHETKTWRLPVELHDTNLNYNGFEYSGQAKICIPVDSVTPSGEITIHCAAQIMQYEIYLAENETYNEQSYIIADPSKGAMEADAVLSWGGPLTERGKLQILKVGGGNVPLEGAVFTLTGTDGSSRTGTTDKKGIIRWEDLAPYITYTLTETTPPAGYAAVEPVTLTVNAAETLYHTVKNDPQHTITVHKVDRQTGYSLRGAVIRFDMIDGPFSTTGITDAAGNIQMNADQLPIGSYRVYEVTPPRGYELDSTVQTIHWAGKADMTLTFQNTRKPTLIISKQDADTHFNLPYATFEVYKNGTLIDTVTTNENGLAYVSGIGTGYYEIRETQAPEGYILNNKVYGINIDLYDPATSDDPRLVVENDAKPGLKIVKTDAITGKPVAGVTFTIKEADGHTITTEVTDAKGEILLEGMTPGVVEVWEQSVPNDYLINENHQLITLVPNQTATVRFQNYPKPKLTVSKLDSVTGDPIQGAKFQVTYASNNTFTGEINDLGTYFTDENGVFSILDLQDGWYRVEELEPAKGYAIKDPAVQECYIKAGTSKALTFENTPLSALVVWKYDSVTHEAVEGATFQVRYLAGTSGTGGTVIGTYKTSSNGSFTVTDLKAGTYVVEEIASDDTHVIDAAPQTAFISGKEQDVVQLYFGNAPKGNLLVKKVDAVTGKPLSDVEFQVTTAEGTNVGVANGKYVTDSSGSFTVSNVEPGTSLIVKERRAKAGYILDDTPQTAVIQSGKTVTLEFRNQPKGTLVIVKRDANTKKPLQGAEFRVTTSDGKYVDTENGSVSSKGLYTTDKEGQIIITGLEPCTVVVTETKAPSGYVLDETPQAVVINANDTQTLYFYNKSTPTGDLKILKLDEASRQPIQGVEFSVSRINGDRLGLYRTNSKGTIYLEDLEPGWYTVQETKAAKGYRLDAEPKDIEVKNGKTATLEITNRLTGSALIHKVDLVTGKGIYGVTFLVSDTKGNPVGQYTSDQNGYVYVDGDLANGRYTIREIQQAEGYLPDTTVKTFWVEYGGCSTITWYNTPVTGQIQITKTSADHNSINGWPAGTAIPGCEFEVYNKAGNLVDTIRTDKNGVAVTRTLPLGQYKVVESKAADFYALDNTPFYVELQFAGQIVRIAATNKSVSTGATITKTGYKEVMPGQMERFTFTGIGNTSTVPLQDFYWRDTIPTDALRLSQVVTGTWNVPSSYKLIYLTNKSGEQYRTLADNLSTRKQYTIDASPVALGLAKDEYITEVMAVFGIVPAGFRQVENPALDFSVVSWLQNGYQFTNQADAGGRYNGAWVQANTRWVTSVYAPTKFLPRTGY